MNYLSVENISKSFERTLLKTSFEINKTKKAFIAKNGSENDYYEHY
jgi:hypothetical protein